MEYFAIDDDDFPRTDKMEYRTHFGDLVMTISRGQICRFPGSSVAFSRWRFPEDRFPYDTFTLYARPKIHYTLGDEKYVCCVFVCLVPVLLPQFDFYLFLFCDFLFGG